MEEEKILVTKSTLPTLEEYTEMIKPIWDSHWLTNNGPIHNKLEGEIEKYLDVENATLFTNGHLSLENALKVLDLPEGGEVITTPFTFISTTHAIARNGLVPVFCDINYDDYTIDVNKIESLITDKTVAIVPVHVYGNVCNVEKIKEIADKYNLKVVYDAAHAFGVKYNGVSVGNFGDLSMFSFHATKVFNTIEGGAVTYHNAEFKQKLNNLKNFGIIDEEHMLCIAGNAKMNEFQAAMGLCNLKHLDENVKLRKELLEYYRKLLQDIKGIKLSIVQEGVESNYAYFPIVVEDAYGINRNELSDILKSHNIYSRKYFYPISNEFDCYEGCTGETPIAKDVSERVLALPLYPDLGMQNVERICKIIRERR